MSCWVVPSVAAELWGVPLAQVLEWISGGQVAARVDEGFTVIDVAPHGATSCGRPVHRGPRPQTWRPVTPQEIAALLNDDPTVIPPVPAPADEIAPPPVVRHVDDDDESDKTIDEESENLGDWHAARRRASFMRIGPARIVRAAS